jgi:hypothetical protein
MVDFSNYLEKLKTRSKKRGISKEFQEVGLEIAKLLEDEKHKSLYIKLAKEMNKEELLSLAKSVSQMKNIKKKGAYFMKVLFNKKKEEKNKC